MLEVRKQLPQLDPLIAFEAAARHGSFARAAEEMNVTASAVSQQIRGLEAQLGIDLFTRGHRSVALTDRGREFHNSVSIALTHLVNAAAEARGPDIADTLHVATDTSIAVHWLMPRLDGFRARFPDTPLHLTVTDVQANLPDDGAAVSVVHGQGGWRGFESARLFAEEVYPVCAPDYLERWNGDFAPEDLARADLIDLEYEHWHWMNWAIWLTERNLPLPAAPRALRIGNYPALIEAARRGQGIALGWRHLVDEYLADGSLVRPVDGSVKTRYGYYVAWPYNQSLSPAAEAFRDWLLEM